MYTCHKSHMSHVTTDVYGPLLTYMYVTNLTYHMSQQMYI